MATRYLVSGGTGDYNSTTNWSATSGGASGASFPTSVDDIIIDFNSANANITVNVLSACKSFNASNYTGTWTISNDFSVNGTTNTGNITLSSGMTITGSASFIKVPTSTTGVITSNGAIFDCNFIFQAAAATTTTITGAMQVNKNITWSLNSSSINTINSGTISVGGDIIHNSPVAGTSPLQMIGSTTATITQFATRFLQTNLIINKTGILNINDLNWGAGSRTLTYTAGIVNHTGILYTASASILSTSGMIWNTIRPSASFLDFTSICYANKIEQIGATQIEFRGTFGFNVNIYSMIGTNGGSVTFKSDIVYVINNSITQSSDTSNLSFFRCSGVNNAIVNLGSNAFTKLHLVSITKITASNKTLRTANGTVDANSKNCFKLDSNINPYSTTR